MLKTLKSNLINFQNMHRAIKGVPKCINQRVLYIPLWDNGVRWTQANVFRWEAYNQNLCRLEAIPWESYMLQHECASKINSSTKYLV